MGELAATRTVYDYVLAAIPMLFLVAFAAGAVLQASLTASAALGAAATAPLTAYALFVAAPER
ncbi:MAG: hypothetical protein ABEH83_07370 [Halobacterium sp.]